MSNDISVASVLGILEWVVFFAEIIAIVLYIIKYLLYKKTKDNTEGKIYKQPSPVIIIVLGIIICLFLSRAWIGPHV